MNADQAARIRSSFDALAPRAGEIVDAFYTRLFKAAPAVKSLFPKDLTKQKQHLASAIALVVKHADNLKAIENALMDMGERHVGYGAQPQHYPVVRDTMLAALAQVAGPLWNKQLHSDWEAALNAVAGAMLKGADRAARKAA